MWKLKLEINIQFYLRPHWDNMYIMFKNQKSNITINKNYSILENFEADSGSLHK